MSRFYARGSDSESESSSDDEPVVQKAPVLTAAYDDLSDDEEDTGKRVVRTAKEKRYGDIMAIVKKIKNYKKNNDMSNILDSFEELTKAHQKALPVIIKEEKGITPSFYLRTLAQLELFVDQQWENKKNNAKGLSKNNAKSLGTLRQKVRKYNKEFEEGLQKFRDNPELLDEEEIEDEKEGEGGEEESESEEEPAVKAKPKREAKKPKPEGGDGGGGDESDDSYWGSSSSSSSSSSDDEGNYASLREYFLKKPGKSESKREKGPSEKRVGRRGRGKREEGGEEGGEEGEWEVVNRGTVAERPLMFSKDQDITPSLVLKKLNEITAVRGKKGTDRREQIDLLTELESIATAHNLGPAIQLKIAFSLVASIFDYSLKVHDVQKVQFWIKLLSKTTEMLNIAKEHKDTLLIDENTVEDQEELEKPPYKLRGCLLTVFERLDEEFLKVLKELDSHSFDYVERVQDERRVCEMLDSLTLYLESSSAVNDTGLMCRAYFKKIEHIYFKFDVRVLKKKRGEFKGETSVEMMQRLCAYIYAKDTTDRLRTRAILCHIYHNALHDNWYEARDLLLMSHLHEVIHHSDPPTQIMYNRALVQLGICAFRHESMRDAHNCLADLLMSARVKELLAQGLMPQHRHDRSAEQEKVERSRQVPFHMQLNLDVIECVYLVSAMMLEVPYLAHHEFDAKRRPISKTFYHQLRTLEKQSLTGPPESMREHVVAGARAMKRGDWAGAYEALVNEKMDKKVWHYFAIYEGLKDGKQFSIREMLMRKLKKKCLKTYLFTYSHVYISISLPQLAAMFEMEESLVHSTVAKMIINQELMASLDEPTKSIVLHRTEPSRLQSMLLQLSDKVNILRETSDRSLETKLQLGQGNQGQGGKGQRFNRQNWKNQRQGQGSGGGQNQNNNQQRGNYTPEQRQAYQEQRAQQRNAARQQQQQANNQ